jgi:non-ribosomal peptide synthetase component F
MYATGATLDIIPEMHFSFPAKLVDYLNEHKITFVFWVPFALINVANFDIFKDKKPLYLQDILFAGEVMPNKHLNYWRRHLPNSRYANLYGPTEITVDCTFYQVDRAFSDDEPLPIGIACRNSGVLILVDQQREADVNEEGELCVRGSSLALGYYNDPEKTQKAFIQNPLNKHYPETIYCTGDIVYKNERGEIMYVGRKDSQIKHNGYRIELGEIENAVLASKMVDNCCAVYDFTNKKIVLYYQAPEELNLSAFRKAVSDKIPRYMIPSTYYREESLKQNSSGKIDRTYYKNLING